MYEDRLTFRRAQESDLPMLGRWLLAPAVARWYPDADSIEDLEDQLGDSRITMNLVLLDGAPIAYVQDYDIHAWKDHPLSFLPLGARDLDTFIGEAALIGRRLGSAYPRLRGDALFAEGAPALGIDPAEENHAAQRLREGRIRSAQHCANRVGARDSDGPVAARRFCPVTIRRSSMSTTVDTWIEQAPDAQRKQLRELRAIILSQAPDVTEALKWGQPCYARKSLFCYLQKAKTHVTLGFQKGVLMSDPEGRLAGDGKQMRRMDLSRAVRGKPVRTTIGDKAAPCPLDKVGCQFSADRPNRLWGEAGLSELGWDPIRPANDFTFVSTWNGFVYTAFVVDVFARRIVGWRVSRSMQAQFVLDALEKALSQRRPTSGLIHHSDRGAQYVSIKYTERLVDEGIEPSVGSVGDSYDNALAETVIGHYKTEVIWRRGPWKSFEAVEFATLEWVDWFNRRRLLEPIGHIPPAEAEDRYYAQLEGNRVAA